MAHAEQGTLMGWGAEWGAGRGQLAHAGLLSYRNTGCSLHFQVDLAPAQPQSHLEAAFSRLAEFSLLLNFSFPLFHAGSKLH